MIGGLPCAPPALRFRSTLRIGTYLDRPPAPTISAPGHKPSFGEAVKIVRLREGSSHWGLLLVLAGPLNAKADLPVLRSGFAGRADSLPDTSTVLFLAASGHSSLFTAHGSPTLVALTFPAEMAGEGGGGVRRTRVVQGVAPTKA